MLEANDDLLQKGGEIGGGGRNPEISDVFDARDEQIKYLKPVWPYFLYAALIVFLLDLLFRRIRLWGKTNLSWDKVSG